MELQHNVNVAKKHTDYFTSCNPTATYIHKKIMFIAGELTFNISANREKNIVAETSKEINKTVSSPLPELLEHDAVGESLPADTDPLQHPVTPELLQHQVGVHLPGLQHISRPTK